MVNHMHLIDNISCVQLKFYHFSLIEPQYNGMCSIKLISASQASLINQYKNIKHKVFKM